MDRKMAVIAGLGMLLIVVGAIGVVLMRDKTEPSANPDNNQQSKPMFSFAGADGWRQGPSNDTSMVLFGPSSADGTSACFTSIEYKTGTVDIDEALSDQVANMAGSNTVMALENTLESTIAAVTAAIKYDLYQYRITSEGSEQTMKGLELGYVQFDEEGYLKIDGHCNEFDELSTTLPALAAYQVK